MLVVRSYDVHLSMRRFGRHKASEGFQSMPRRRHLEVNLDSLLLAHSDVVQLTRPFDQGLNLDLVRGNGCLAVWVTC